MAKNWEHAAGMLWPILVDAAKDKRKPTYSDLAPIINTNPLSVRNALDPIQRHCIDYKLPPLTSIVVGKNTGIPGDGFIAWDIDDIETAQQIVYQQNWDLVENPFGGFGDNDTTESFSREIVNNPGKAKDIYSKIKVRGPAQAVFRSALLLAYDGECAVCGFSFEEGLEAAHIISWSKASHSERISPSNGILLCANHHKLYDSGWIIITEDFKIKHIDEDYENNDYGSADKAATVDLDGKSLRLPNNTELWPSAELIRKRNKQN